jgi:Pyruvate/2-oxoacid:ferredoxin oxidoreductase delta subunit
MMGTRTSTLFRLFLLAACAFKGNLAVQHTLGGTTVDVSLEIIDENNSTKFCVDYLAGDDYGRDFKKACFSSFFTDGGKFRLCEVKFDDDSCVQCKPCTSFGEDGFDLDCFNIEPEENSIGCTVLNNENIQKVLVDNEFEGTDLLEFNMTEAIAQANGNTNAVGDVGGGATSASSARIVGATLLTCVLVMSIFGFALIL